MDKATGGKSTIAVLVLLSFPTLCTTNMITTGKDACGTDGVCMCVNLVIEYLVQCNDRNLSEIPLHIPQETTSLSLTDNDITQLHERTFQDLSSLHTLLMQRNKVGMITKQIFAPLNKMETLNLRLNRIQHVPTGTFQTLTSLDTLDLTSNIIHHIDEGAFKNLSRLTALLLGRNKISVLPEKIFSDLEQLSYILLDNNLLQKLPEWLFCNMENLISLSLDYNKLSEVSKDVFAPLKTLQVLELGNNELERLPDELYISGSTTMLILSKNKLGILPKNGFDGAYNLNSLQFSENRLQRISRHNFGTIKEVKALHISYNHISSLPLDLFRDVVISHIIDFSNNRLTTLPGGIFDTNNRTHGLEILLLHRNQLVYLPENVFIGLQKLRTLCLFHNNIQVLAVGTFAVIGVEKIYLFGNNLSVLINASFNNENIAEIHLYGNPLNVMNSTAVTGVSKKTKVFIDCLQVEKLQQLNTEILCVTPKYVPRLTMESQLYITMTQEGFHCGPEQENRNIECSPCPRGTFGEKGHCIPCYRGGFYQDEIGTASKHDQDVCKRCANGTYVRKGEGKSIGECMVCPDGTDKNSHAGYRACFCLDNYARKDRFEHCFVCIEEGVNCSGKDYLSLQLGFYWSWDIPGANATDYKKFVDNLNTENNSFDSHTEYKGEIPRSFACPRRQSCNNTQDNINVICSEGYKGWLCTKCEKNFYAVRDHCFPCPQKEWLFIEVSLILCSCVIIYVVLNHSYKREKNHNEHDRSIVDIFTSQGKIALGFYQVVGEFITSVHAINWAHSLKYIADLISLIELNILRLFVRPQCFHESLKVNPKIEFVIGLAFPASLISLSFVCYQILVGCYKCKKRHSPDKVSRKMYVKSLKSNAITIVVVTLFVTYPPICTVIFQLYPRACETFCLDMANNTCKVLLRSDYDIECKNLKAYNILAYMATAGYVFAYPAVLLFLLRKKFQLVISKVSHSDYSSINRDETDELQPPVNNPVCETTYPGWVHFLCENYKPQFWYWEIVELTRKVTQTVLITLLGWKDKLTVLVTICISVLFLTLHARCLPMKNTFEQRLQMFSLIAILVNVLVAAMDVPDEYGDAMSIVLIVLNVVVIAIIAAEVALGLFIRLRHMKVHNIFMTAFIKWVLQWKR